MIYIRVDANRILGRGHLSRAIAVAEMVTSESSVTLAIGKVNESYCAPLIKGFTCLYIDSDEDFQNVLSPSDTLVVDSYKIDNEWLKRFRSSVQRLIVINDLPQEVRDVDVVINHSPGVEGDMFSKSEPPRLCLGLDYAILRKPFLKSRIKDTNQKIGTGILVSYGAADPYRLGEKVALLLLKSGFKDPIYLVTAKSGNGRSLFNDYPNLHYLRELTSDQMIGYMQRSKLAVVPSSTLALEAIAVGTPIVTSYFVPNQNYNYTGIISKGLGVGIGWSENQRDARKLATMALRLYGDDLRMTAIKIRQRQMLDGQSDARIREAIVQN